MHSILHAQPDRGESSSLVPGESESVRALREELQPHEHHDAFQLAGVFVPAQDSNNDRQAFLHASGSIVEPRELLATDDVLDGAQLPFVCRWNVVSFQV